MACSAVLLGGLGGAQADTIVDYTLSVCLGSGYCGSTTNFGSVTVDINSAGTSATISYDLTKGLIDDFEEPSDADVTFNMSSSSNVTGWSVTASNDSSASWGKVSNGEIDPDGGSFDPGSAFGIFAQGVNCSEEFGTCGSTLTITVTGTDLGVGTNSNGYFAALDTVTGDPSNGAVATTLSTTPIPAALPLFATVIGAGFLGFRSRRRTMRVAAA